MSERTPDAWEVVVQAGRDPITGKHRQISRTFRGSLREARKARAELIVEVGKGRHTGWRATLDDLFGEWIMPLLLITIDTNIVDPKEVAPLEAVLTDIPHEIGFVSVTEREHGYEIGYLGRRVTESGVWGESPWGSSDWSGPTPAQFVVGESTVAPDGAIPGHYDVVAGDGSLPESALSIISAGSFPKIGHRENLTSNVRRQLRDAMIFDAPAATGVRDGVSSTLACHADPGWGLGGL